MVFTLFKYHGFSVNVKVAVVAYVRNHRQSEAMAAQAL